MRIPIKRIIKIRSTNIVRELYTFIIALLPIILVYNTPAVNLSLGTVVLLLFLPYALFCITKRIDRAFTGLVGIIVILYVYFIARSQGDVRTILLYVAGCIHLCGFATGSVDADRFRSAVEKIAVISALCVFLQVISHYMLGKNISFTILSALQRDYKLIYYEQVSRFSLYRPTGLFLEPAMLSEYCIFALISCLFPAGGNIKKTRVALITAGIVLTTSGIGTLLSALVFGWYFFIKRESLSKWGRNVFRGIALAAIALLILSRFSFFNAAMARVFTNFEGYNALEGRTWRWSQAINPMKGQLLWLGYGALEDFPYYLTGIPDTIYRCGLIAVILEILLLIRLIAKKNNTFVRLSGIVFLVLLFVAKITSVPYQVFFLGLMVADMGRDLQWTKLKTVTNGSFERIGL